MPSDEDVFDCLIFFADCAYEDKHSLEFKELLCSKGWVAKRFHEDDMPLGDSKWNIADYWIKRTPVAFFVLGPNYTEDKEFTIHKNRWLQLALTRNPSVKVVPVYLVDRTELPKDEGAQSFLQQLHGLFFTEVSDNEKIEKRNNKITGQLTNFFNSPVVKKLKEKCVESAERENAKEEQEKNNKQFVKERVEKLATETSVSKDDILEALKTNKYNSLINAQVFRTEFDDLCQKFGFNEMGLKEKLSSWFPGKNAVPKITITSDLSNFKNKRKNLNFAYFDRFILPTYPPGREKPTYPSSGERPVYPPGGEEHYQEDSEAQRLASELQSGVERTPQQESLGQESMMDGSPSLVVSDTRVSSLSLETDGAIDAKQASLLANQPAIDLTTSHTMSTRPPSCALGSTDAAKINCSHSREYDRPAGNVAPTGVTGAAPQVLQHHAGVSMFEAPRPVSTLAWTEERRENGASVDVSHALHTREGECGDEEEEGTPV